MVLHRREKHFLLRLSAYVGRILRPSPLESATGSAAARQTSPAAPVLGNAAQAVTTSS